MCVIAIKKRNVEFPKVETIKQMCDNNPDGFALVYNVEGKGTKSMRSLKSEDLYKEYRKLLRYSSDKVSFFIHARIKTHGTININNCHGWYSKECKLYFAHNGILSVKNRDDMTDSETFLRDLFTPAFIFGGWDAAEKAINAVISTSKFVFMDNQGEIHHYGQYITDNGMLYSNNTYKEERRGSYYYYKPQTTYYKPSTPNATKFRVGDIIECENAYGNFDKGSKWIVKEAWTYGINVTLAGQERGTVKWIGAPQLDYFKKYVGEKKDNPNAPTQYNLSMNTIVEAVEDFYTAAGRYIKKGDLLVVNNVYGSGFSAYLDADDSEYCGRHVWVSESNYCKLQIV